MQADIGAVVAEGCAHHCVHPDTVRHVRSMALPEADLAQVASVFKLLGDPTRAKLLYAMLEAGEVCVCDLAASTDLLETTVSQSLRLLRASKVVAARRQGRLMYYRLADAHVRMLLDLTREHVTHTGDASPGSDDAVALASTASVPVPHRAPTLEARSAATPSVDARGPRRRHVRRGPGAGA